MRATATDSRKHCQRKRPGWAPHAEPAASHTAGLRRHIWGNFAGGPTTGSRGRRYDTVADEQGRDVCLLPRTYEGGDHKSVPRRGGHAISAAAATTPHGVEHVF